MKEILGFAGWILYIFASIILWPLNIIVHLFLLTIIAFRYCNQLQKNFRKKLKKLKPLSQLPHFIDVLLQRS